jgi:hypothetical protein
MERKGIKIQIFRSRLLQAKMYHHFIPAEHYAISTPSITSYGSMPISVYSSHDGGMIRGVGTPTIGWAHSPQIVQHSTPNRCDGYYHPAQVISQDIHVHQQHHVDKAQEFYAPSQQQIVMDQQTPANNNRQIPQVDKNEPQKSWKIEVDLPNFAIATLPRHLAIHVVSSRPVESIN